MKSPKNRLGRVVGILLEKKAIVCFAKTQAMFPQKILTPYRAPKDVKSSSIIEECFARVKVSVKENEVPTEKKF